MGTGRIIHPEMHSGVELKPAGWNLGAAGIKQSSAQNLSLGGSGDDQMNLIGGENLIKTEGDRPLGHPVGISSESTGILNSRGWLKGHHPAATAGR